MQLGRDGKWFMQMTAEYLQCAQLLLEQHRLVLEDDDPDDQIEVLEERFIILWDRLDDDQHKSLNGLSSDLAWLRRGGQNPPMGRKPEDVSKEDGFALVESERVGDWHSHLHAIRLCRVRYSPGEVAMRRASAYSELGLFEVAALFREFAGNCGEPKWNFEANYG